MYENDKIVRSGKLTVISNFKGIKFVLTYKYSLIKNYKLVE